MKIDVKKRKVLLELSVDEVNVLVAFMQIVKDSTDIQTFTRMAKGLEFKLSAAVAFISNMDAYRDGN